MMQRSATLLALGALALLGCRPALPPPGQAQRAAKLPRVASRDFEAEGALLEALERAAGELRAATDAGKALAASLRFASAASIELEARAAELELRAALLDVELQQEAEALARAHAGLLDTQAARAALDRQAQRAPQARRAAPRLAGQLRAAQATARSLDEEVLRIELERVRTRQGLVAAQIAMARRQAPLDGRNAAAAAHGEPTERKTPR